MHPITMGIDLGGSATKIVAIREGRVLPESFFTFAHPAGADGATRSEASLTALFERYLAQTGVRLNEVSSVRFTGVGSTFVSRPVLGLPFRCVDEFAANAAGVRHAVALERMLVVSMGTGTSFVMIEGDTVRHVGGMALGGGTIQGLSRLLFDVADVSQLAQLSAWGDEKHVNLQIGDLCNNDLPGLPLHATASLLGRADRTAAASDLSCGLLYMVLQTIGSAAVLAAAPRGLSDIVLIGNLTQLSLCRRVFDELTAMYGVTFHIPDHALYCTAMGAALI